MKYFRYCGWAIASEWDLSPFAPLILDTCGHPDITVRLAQVPTSLPNAERCTAVWAINQREGLWKLDGVARYRVSQQGQLIEVEPAAWASVETVALFLLRAVLPLVALYRGEFLLNGSGVARDGKACVFIGPSGVGKSTAAAILVGGGWDLVGDSLLRVTQDKAGEFVIHPQGPGLWLWNDMLEKCGLQTEFFQLRKDIGLRRLNISALGNTVFLSRIINLRLQRVDQGSLHAEHRSGGYAFEVLIQHLAGSVWQRFIANRIHLFQWGTKLAKQTEYQKVELPTFDNAIPDHFERSMEQLASKGTYELWVP